MIGLNLQGQINMTLAEFYENLENIKNRYRWEVTNGIIRGHLLNNTCPRCKILYCPITAVAREIFGKTFDCQNYSSMIRAYKFIGLKESDSNEIIDMTDKLSDNNIKKILIDEMV